jgi:hypothetical protein
MVVLKEIKGLISTILNRMDIYGLYSLRRSGPLHADGWFRSYREHASVDADGEPLPWITYPAIEFIRRRIKNEMKVFEFGSGGSTLWWADRVSEVISIEHDRVWHEKFKNIQKDNVRTYHIDLICNGDYSKKILEYNDYFDLVIIDGRDRVNCMKNCLPALRPDGVVILDNSDRPDYTEGVDFLISNGFKKIEFVGFCPIVNFKSETSIFYRAMNVFGI